MGEGVKRVQLKAYKSPSTKAVQCIRPVLLEINKCLCETPVPSMHTSDVDGASRLEEGAVHVVRCVAHQRAVHHCGHLCDAECEFVEVILSFACETKKHKSQVLRAIDCRYPNCVILKKFILYVH